MYDDTNKPKNFSRQNKLAILAEICQANNVNPQSGNYAGLVRRIAVTRLNASITQAKEYTKSLTTAYFTDHWKTLLQITDEPELEIEDITIQLPSEPSNTLATDNTHQTETRRSALEHFTLNSPPDPVKKLETQPNTQQDHLTEKQITQIYYTTAKKDTFDGVGRLILSDARDIADNKHLQIEDVLAMWRRHYPIIDIDSKSNVALIYWEGKADTRNLRDMNRYVQPTASPLSATNNHPGDIYDETYDTEAPEAMHELPQKHT